jgi:hypothetical protein
MEFTIPAVIGDYLPLEVKLNIVLEVAFNSIQPGARHASGLPLHFPRIKAVLCDKNVDSVDILQCARSLAERDAQIHRPILTEARKQLGFIAAWVTDLAK